MDCITRLPYRLPWVINEIPTGGLNCANLAFTTVCKFNPDTLEIKLDGRQLMPTLDYTIGSDNESFTLVLNPTDRNRLNTAPRDSEELLVNYQKATSTMCITSL